MPQRLELSGEFDRSAVESRGMAGQSVNLHTPVLRPVFPIAVGLRCWSSGLTLTPPFTRPRHASATARCSGTVRHGHVDDGGIIGPPLASARTAAGRSLTRLSQAAQRGTGTPPLFTRASTP